MLVAPSPKKQRLTSSVPRYWAANATPVAIGRCAPTIANEPIAPTLTSVRCIEPPLPPQSPSALPRISPNDRSSGAPIGKDGAVAAVGAGHRVRRAKRATAADDDRLLSLAEVRGAPNESLREQTVALLLEEADLEHRPQPVDLFFDRHIRRSSCHSAVTAHRSGPPDSGDAWRHVFQYMIWPPLTLIVAPVM